MRTNKANNNLKSDTYSNAFGCAKKLKKKKKKQK